MHLSLDAFAEKHNTSKRSLYTMRCTGALPKNIFSKGRGMTIDEEYFISRNKFKDKIYNENERRYYILSEHMTDLEIARYMSAKTNVSDVSWYLWIQEHLFILDRGGIMNFRVSKNHRLFHKYSRRLVEQCG